MSNLKFMPKRQFAEVKKDPFQAKIIEIINFARYFSLIHNSPKYHEKHLDYDKFEGFSH